MYKKIISFLVIQLCCFCTIFAQYTDTAKITLYDTLVVTTDTTVKIKDVDEVVTKEIVGIASYYAKKFEGRRTANGETFSHKKFTAACNVLPLGTSIRVTNLSNGKTVVVRVNDRLHPKMKRVVDLTYAAAQKLDFIAKGLTKVKVEVLKKTQKTK
jgi:rare lipoprotein A